MERYIKKQFKRYQEKEEKEEKDEYEIDPKVKDIIETLRDNNFGNEDTRKHLLHLLTSLHNTKDKVARKVFKAIGNLFTEIGDDLLKGGE
jgi:hypothetical protein